MPSNTVLSMRRTRDPAWSCTGSSGKDMHITKILKKEKIAYLPIPGLTSLKNSVEQTETGSILFGYESWLLYGLILLFCYIFLVFFIFPVCFCNGRLFLIFVLACIS